MRIRSTAALIVGATLLVALTILMLGGSRRGIIPTSLDHNAAGIKDNRALVQSELPAPKRSEAAAQPSVSKGESAPGEKLPTARVFLADYWGARWNEIEPAMVKLGVNLDCEYEFSPWEEAVGHIEEMVHLDEKEIEQQIDIVLDWPRNQTIESLSEKYSGLAIENEQDLEKLLVVAAPFNDELRILADTRAEHLQSRIRDKWNRGDFIRAPLTTIGLSQDNDKGFYATAQASHGWAILLVLKHEECPEIVDLMNQANAVINRRDASIRQQFRRR